MEHVLARSERTSKPGSRPLGGRCRRRFKSPRRAPDAAWTGAQSIAAGEPAKGAVLEPKVFGIGFHKTGTTSLGLALERLGYRVCGKLGVHRAGIAQEALALAWARLDDCDAFQDNPWPLLYRQLDARCPGSRFILTIRPRDRWIESVCRHFGDASTPMREWIYGVGSPRGNEAAYLRRYDAHNAAVKAYFENRPGDLLVFRTGEGDGWDELCRFLDHAVPADPFPHGNSRAAREERRDGARWRRAARRGMRSIRQRCSAVTARGS